MCDGLCGSVALLPRRTRDQAAVLCSAVVLRVRRVAVVLRVMGAAVGLLAACGLRLVDGAC